MPRTGAFAAVIALAGLVLAPAARGQQPAPGADGTARAAFAQELTRWMAVHGVKRASMAVSRSDRLVLAEGFGGRQAGERVGVWSLSKAITAVCVAALVREGLMSLDEPIGPRLAAALKPTVPPADERLARATVAQLIGHRSGLPSVVGGNRFAPGAFELLRQRAPKDATAHMLLPEILRLRPSHEPGAEYQYSNVGYLLLGQIIEQATGESYEAACGRRVLARAGVRAPALEPTWGRLLHSTAGWALSGPEYLAFARLLRPGRHLVLDAAGHARLRALEGHWTDAARTDAYTLGVLVRPVAGGAPHLYHTGGWRWRQADAAGGPVDENPGTLFVLAGDGIAWFVSFDRLEREGEQRARTELAEAMWRARRAVQVWPETDAFARHGVGPLAAPR